VANYVDTFQESLGRLVHERTEFFDLFYDLFIAASDEVASKFAGVDMERQKWMLRESLKEILVFFLGHRINPYMTGLAKVHAQRGVHPGLYDLWLDKLLEAARLADDKFDDADELAWRLVLAPGIAFMKFYYDRGGQL
jgi:hypothetical protein